MRKLNAKWADDLLKVTQLEPHFELRKFDSRTHAVPPPSTPELDLLMTGVPVNTNGFLTGQL